MLSQFKIKYSEPIMLRSWNGNEQKWLKLCAKNDATMKALFNATASGEIPGFFLKSKTSFRVITRSTKETGCLQYSKGFYHGETGELIPLSDSQLHNYEDLAREGYPSGIWEVINL